jgi:diaminopimelate decarboxylase
MTEFSYRSGELCAEDIPLAQIADAVATPFYCYSLAGIARRYREFETAVKDLPATICFALKANSNLAVVNALAALGAGADVVSEGELRIALEAGVPARRIVFSGVGKTEREIDAALDAKILQLNVESEAELLEVDRIARRRGMRAPVALRVNPDVAANTHAKIATGKSENKFGIDFDHAWDAYKRAASMPGISLQGLAVHIGSQLTDLDPFREAFARLAAMTSELKAQGLAVPRLDLGGGLGIVYGSEKPASAAQYAAVVAGTVGKTGCELLFEPGRFLVAEAGVLVTRVVRIKEGVTHRFVIVDAGMNDLLRPALYDAYHPIIPVREPAEDALFAPVEVVGPVCETGDTFSRNRPLPALVSGDLLAIGVAGAYGAVMASGYNARPLVPEVMVNGADFSIIRPRPDLDSLIDRDRLPDWAVGQGRRKEALS